MNLNDLLVGKGIDPHEVLVLRHRPFEPELNKVLPWLAAEKPEVFNAYQQAQNERVESAMTRSKYVASFIRHEAGQALFVGLYEVHGSKSITRKQYWAKPANAELKTFGMTGYSEESTRSSILWFDLTTVDFYSHWKGKLIVRWPPPERSWFRRAQNNDMSVVAILDESALVDALPEWDEIDLTWNQLGVIPSRLKMALAQWRGIYYIFDSYDGKGYVGAAYGSENLLGRWRQYAERGHGGNKLLRQRDPRHFRFTILQRVSPDLEAAEVIRLEASWKLRLHSRHPTGLNDN
jgi:hypothetical protein